MSTWTLKKETALEFTTEAKPLHSDAAVPDDSNIYSRDMDEVKNLADREEIADSSAPYMAYKI